MRSTSSGVARGGNSIGLAWPCCAGGGVGWLLELYLEGISEGWMFWNFIDGGDGLGWLVEWWVIGGFLRWCFI
jgi:hypothetical protein